MVPGALGGCRGCAGHSHSSALRRKSRCCSCAGEGQGQHQLLDEERLGGGKGGFSSLGREPVRTARRGWRRRGGKHRLCKKRNWSYRRLVLSQLSSGPWVTLEAPWEGACHPCQRLSPSSGHACVPWEASSAAQIPKDPNKMCLLEGFIGRLELLREEFVGENTLQAARRLGLLVCRSEGPWRVPAEAGTPGHRRRSRQGSMPRWWSPC